MTIRSAATAASASLGLLAAACVAAQSAGDAARVETVALAQLAAEPEQWRGQTVRTCGSSFQGRVADGEWQLSTGVAGRHPTGIRVLGCGGAAPARDADGCLSGRIARRDGRIEPTAEGQPRVVSSATISSEWYLHAQCTAAPGG